MKRNRLQNWLSTALSGSTATFTHNDAWILYAIRPGAKDCPLSEIIARADYVNHAIPTRLEIESGLTKGLRAGLLERSPAGVRYVQNYREKIASVTQKPHRAMDAWDALHKYLSEQIWEQKSEDEFVLTDDAVKTAYQQYVAGFSHLKKQR